MINILTDSCSDLNTDLAVRYGIGTIPLYVFINETTYRDSVDINLQQLFQFVEETKKLPQTSAPSVPDFEKFFSETSGEIIFISIGSKLSATYQNAILAAENLYDRTVRIFDSNNLSTGIGLMALRAAEMRDQNRSLEEILQILELARPKVRTSFVIDTLDYLYKGGRCTAMENIIGSLLKIRPVIEVKADGTLGVKEKNRGTRKKALDSMMESFKKDLALIDPHRVFITHSGCEEDAQYLAVEVAKNLAIDELNITIAGATIASHCGPNTIGIIYQLM
jgi:DegV family protein with EDD domain